MPMLRGRSQIMNTCFIHFQPPLLVTKRNCYVTPLADKPTRGQSSRGLDNSRTGQLADNE